MKSMDISELKQEALKYLARVFSNNEVCSDAHVVQAAVALILTPTPKS